MADEVDKTILILHPRGKRAEEVVKDVQNRPCLHTQQQALFLSLERAPNSGGTHYIIGRNKRADIFLSDSAVSSTHCTVSVTRAGTPYLHERSTNGTTIDGKLLRNTTREIKDNMRIDFRGALFAVKLPFRGEQQRELEQEVRKHELRAQTPVEPPLWSKAALDEPTKVEMFGTYTRTHREVDGFLGSRLLKTLGKTEELREGPTSFAGTYFHSPNGAQHLRWFLSRLKKANKENRHLIEIKDEVVYLGTTVFITDPVVGTLRDWFSKSPCSYLDASKIMGQLLDGVKYLHDLDLVHGQICLDNVFVKSLKPFHIELGGFATVVNHTDRPFATVCCPPEIWEHRFRDSHSPKYWEEAIHLHHHRTNGYRQQPSYKPVDIWCAGAVCSELTLQSAPRYIDEKRPPEEQCAAYVGLICVAQDAEWAEKLDLPLKSMSPALHGFLRKLLALNPDARIRAEDCHKEPFLNLEIGGSGGDCLERRALEDNQQERSQKRQKTGHGS